MNTTTLADNPAWTHLENISVCARAKDGMVYTDHETQAALARLNAVRAEYGTQNVLTGNAVPIAPGRLGIYVRVDSL